MPLLRRVVAVLARLLATSRERGVVDVIGSSGRWGWQWLTGRPRAGHASGGFGWDGRTVPYFVHRYHYTWLNERAVEVSLALDLLDRHPGAEVLEVGNVLAHYTQVSHPVVDKYEHAPGVLNADVADLDLGRSFDLVLAISTLEHVGLDEDVVDPAKPARAIERLKAHLRPGGQVWITHPVGYNPTLDAQLRSGEIASNRMRALRREKHRNVWKEVPVEDVWGTPYDRLLYTAHAIVVVELDAP
jgi:SAM-dependent methyltransferase